MVIFLKYSFAILLHNLMAGNKIEKVCDLCHITLNKNAVYGDSSALAPGGVRIGKLSISLSLSVDLAGLDKL